MKRLEEEKKHKLMKKFDVDEEDEDIKDLSHLTPL